MNLNHLSLFYAVYKESSISLGADRLHVSQPAVSKQLKEFESALHTKLFNRHPKGVTATESGHLLASYAEKIFHLEADAELAVAELDGLKRGLLKIGASLTIGNYLLPPMLSLFHRRYPGIEVHLEIANTVAVQDKLINGELDIGFTEGFVDSDDLQADVFGEDELIAIAFPEHKIFATPSPTLSTLCDEEFVLREQGSGTREVIERAVALRGFSLRCAMTLGDIEAVKRAVAAGIGVGFVSAYSVGTELQLKTVRRIEIVDFVVRRPLHRLVHRHRYTTKAVTALLPFVSSHKQIR